MTNVGFRGDSPVGVTGWTGEGANDLHELPCGEHVFEAIPYHITDPAANAGRGCIGLSSRPGYARRVEIAIGRKVTSLYLLHALSGGSGLAGMLTIDYADGSSHQSYVRRDQEVLSWWMPPDTQNPRLRVAWEGANATCRRVGVSQWGFDQPHPDKEIQRLVLEAAIDGAQWMVCALTLGEEPVYFPTSATAFRMPDIWGAAEVVYGRGRGPGRKSRRWWRLLSIGWPWLPRWVAAGIDQVRTVVRYPASAGYVAYDVSAFSTQASHHRNHHWQRRSSRLPIPASNQRSTMVVGVSDR